MPDYKDLLEFLNLRAQASELSVSDPNPRKSKLDISSSKKIYSKNGAIASLQPVHMISHLLRSPFASCVDQRACPKFRGMQHDTKVSTLKTSQALLDNASSASFISEHLSQSLQLAHANQSLRISGIAGLSCKAPLRSVTSFTIASIYPSDKRINVTAIVVPQVTCNLPLHPIPLKTE